MFRIYISETGYIRDIYGKLANQVARRYAPGIDQKQMKCSKKGEEKNSRKSAVLKGFLKIKIPRFYRGDFLCSRFRLFYD